MNGIVEVQKAMNNEGFFPRDLQGDGSLHRFKKDSQDKGKSAWVVIYQNHTVRGGELFYVAIWGDWFDPENIYKYCSLTTQSTFDKKLIEDQIKKAEKRRMEEQVRVWDETAARAVEIFRALPETGTTDYLERKRVEVSLYGVKIEGECVIVPVRDVNDKLWGLQRIFPDGKKLFLPGTKKRGNFHVLRAEQSIDAAGILYVCEGFATAASIRLATGQNVACAFDAGNLESVCESLRTRFAGVALVVCGDDDAFTKRPDGAAWNPGREKAEAAAKRFLGRAVFPEFPENDPEKKLTDFNDLHCEFGLNAVKEQILGVKAEKHYITALGHKGATYYYTSNRNKQIMALTSHGADQLLDLQPLGYWESRFNGKQGVDWKQAQTLLKEQCWNQGIFSASNVRGLGVWMDEGRVIVHLGNRLLVDNVEVDLHAIKSRYIYSLEEVQRSIIGKPINTMQCGVLVDLIKGMTWTKPQSATYFLGWLVSSMICGILPWRPHMWLVGSSGAGKSTLYELLGRLHHYGLHNLGGGTTEAGLRRSVRGSAIAVIFDEFELDNAHTMLVNQSILAFMRQASSETAARVVKADGQSGTVSYDPRFCAFVSGVRPSFNNEADRNRFTMIELDKTKQNPTQWAEVSGLIDKIDTEYACGLFLRTISLIKPYLKNRATFERVIAQRFYSRFAQQFAPILAGYVSLIQDDTISFEDADNFVASLKLEDEVDDIKDQSDDEAILGQLLQCKIRTQDLGDRSIKELVSKAYLGDTVANDMLLRHGLKWVASAGKLFIASKHPELTKLFDKTRFAVNWKYSFARIPGADRDKTANFFGQTLRGVLIPVPNTRDH